MDGVPLELRETLQRYRQEHVLAGWDALADAQRTKFVAQLQHLDLDLLERLYRERERAATVPDASRIGAIAVIPARGSASRDHIELGEAALRRGEVAVLLVAGGQGSRLGCSFPKGMYPIGPVSGATLFEIHAAKVLATRRRYGGSIPFLVMTSDATHEETVAYFNQHQFFGLPAEDVWFFRQGTMPALDMQSGKLLLTGPGELCLSPNGHGGTLKALVDNGILRRLQQRGIRHLFYFQVDNPLVKVADPLFIGQNLSVRAEVSTKVVEKVAPTERMGVLALIDGRCSVIEYSDLPEAMAQERDAAGRLKFWAGSTAIHYFAVDFLERVSLDPAALPYHIARKKVAHVGTGGKMPERENAIKFELFIFDALPLAERSTVVETVREEEFAPLKNATGTDSEETVKQALVSQAARWLEAAGVHVPKTAHGEPAFPLEISPLMALDRGQLKDRVGRGLRIEGPLHLKSRNELSKK